MTLPSIITGSGVFRRLATDPELATAVESLRDVAARLAETVSRTVPSFTDHTTRHMDALWAVADQVLTSAELEQLREAEAFLLATGFYLHDIGMAYAATDEGLSRIRSSTQYQSFLAKARLSHSDSADLEARAVAYAVRMLHATAATELATQPVPGTRDVFLLDSRQIRETWGATCGRIAASHHWNLDAVEAQLGSQGVVPLPGGRSADLAFAAAVLRLVDYAHINRDRAHPIDRAFRPPIPADSLVHWLAQEHVDGPYRDGSEIVYRAAQPITDVDAWWLYYEMLRGLDTEIRAVKRYLDRRSPSRGRLSLQGVRGSASPEEVAEFIRPDGFLPIEINLRTGSMDKLVGLLAGESLYGPNPMAAVRELIQNARDAVMLKAAIASTDFEKAALSIPIRVSLKTGGSPPTLEVGDSGVGMTRKVMTDYLISIASDYWTSQFAMDFPQAQTSRFQPAGRFGIGFLAVFMLGDTVVVESNRAGGERYRMFLRGVGRRGEIITVSAPTGSGTTVRVELRASVVKLLQPLAALVRAYAPMLPHGIKVEVDDQTTSIPVGWLNELDGASFHQWTSEAVDLLARHRVTHMDPELVRLAEYSRGRMRAGAEALSEAAKNWPVGWPEYRDEHVRLLASFEGQSLLCVKGLAVQPLRTPGFVGVIDLESATPDTSRRHVLSADIQGILRRATEGVKDQVIGNINAIGREGLLIRKTGFLSQCATTYGPTILVEASLPWISLLRPPGEVHLVNCATLLKELTEARSLFVTDGPGPWTAMRRWEDSTSAASLTTEPAVVLDEENYVNIPYARDEEIGPLARIWPRHMSAPLFGIVLRLAAEAWQISPEQLGQQEGWHHEGTNVWGRFTRP